MKRLPLLTHVHNGPGGHKRRAADSPVVPAAKERCGSGQTHSQSKLTGEIHELRSGLVSQYAFERKEAIQKTIASMTLGKDVSSLFPDVLKNIATHDLDQKKLVYLYLMNYAKSYPELCILAVNTFVKDTEDPNPLVRALAIRTMGCVRVSKMIDYMEIPLSKTLRDDHPYVRKTAAICVAKFFDLAPEKCVEEGFVTGLQSLLDDSNPMVVANVVNALAEIQSASPDTNCFLIDTARLTKLLGALNECTEWGRVAILNALAAYTPASRQEAEHINERVIPQFQHANPSVLLSAVKAVIAHLPSLSEELQASMLRKMGPPLVTLVSSPPEVQYVALRNIRLIVQKFPTVLSRDLRIFFCKYNDPPYLKFEKLEIMVAICTARNVDQLLAELREYSMEVDMEFVRRAVRAIGQCAIKIENSAEKCVKVLLGLAENKTNPLVFQEVVCVFKDILRKYPFEDIVLPVLTQNIEEVDEPEARAALIWIVGQFCSKIQTAQHILSTFVSSFSEESSQAQLALLTACVKLYIANPTSAQSIIQGLLQTATTKSDNADVRDRAYIYWRLLSSDTNVAKSVVLAEKPPIDTPMEVIYPQLLNELLSQLSTLASVYHKPAATFIGRGRFGADAIQKQALEEQKVNAKTSTIVNKANNGENLLDLDDPSEQEAAPPSGSSTPANILDDLTDIFGSVTADPKPASDPLQALSTVFGTQDIASFSSSNAEDPFQGLNPTSAPSKQATPPPPQPASRTEETLVDLF